MAVRGLLSSLQRAVHPSMDMPSQTITDQHPNSWTNLQATIMSPQLLRTLSHHCEPALICEKHGRQWWTCQFWLSLTNANWDPQCWQWAQSPLEDVRPSGHSLDVWFWSIGQRILTSGPQEVILSGFGSAHSVPPCTKEQIPVLLIGKELLQPCPALLEYL